MLLCDITCSLSSPQTGASNAILQLPDLPFGVQHADAARGEDLAFYLQLDLDHDPKDVVELGVGASGAALRAVLAAKPKSLHARELSEKNRKSSAPKTHALAPFSTPLQMWLGRSTRPR